MAPGKSEAQGCALIAEGLAVGLDEATVEQANAHALERYEVDSRLVQATRRSAHPRTFSGDESSLPSVTAR